MLSILSKTSKFSLLQHEARVLSIIEWSTESSSTQNVIIRATTHLCQSQMEIEQYLPHLKCYSTELPIRRGSRMQRALIKTRTGLDWTGPDRKCTGSSYLVPPTCIYMQRYCAQVAYWMVVLIVFLVFADVRLNAWWSWLWSLTQTSKKRLGGHWWQWHRHLSGKSFVTFFVHCSFVVIFLEAVLRPWFMT